MSTIHFPKVLLTIAAVTLVGSGLHGLRRGEFRRRRQWGEMGGPKELPPIRGRDAKAWGLWLIIAGVGLLVWGWRAQR